MSKYLLSMVGFSFYCARVFRGDFTEFSNSFTMKGFHAKSNGGNTTAEVGYFLYKSLDTSQNFKECFILC